MKKIDPAFLGLLVHEVIPNDSCLVFCSTKKLCSSFAILICRISMRYFLTYLWLLCFIKNIFTLIKSCRPLKEFKTQEKLALLEALREEGLGNVDEILKKTIPYGVAFHHSGM